VAYFRHDSSSPTALFEQHLPTINEAVGIICQRNRLSADERDEFRSIVYVKVLEDNCAVLRRFAGRSSLRTFLVVVVQRLFLDYRNGLWGRWRPSACARRSGHVAVAVQQLVTRDGWTLDEALRIVAVPESDRRQIEDIVAAVPKRSSRRPVSEAVLAQIPDKEAPIDQRLMFEDLAAPAAQVATTLDAAMAGLGRADRLILFMRFRDGRRISVIAQILGIPPKRLYRRVERLLKRLRNDLERQGCAAPAAALAREEHWYDLLA
jgi:RNA polymerase sigma factor (sigma-70 family)